MAKRSTRNKIRFQSDKIVKKFDAILVHLQGIDEFAEGRSVYIKENLPSMVMITEECKKAFIRFHEGL